MRGEGRRVIERTDSEMREEGMEGMTGARRSDSEGEREVMVRGRREIEGKEDREKGQRTEIERGGKENERGGRGEEK
jgi:hypothetical protein